jgi:hypothetical protein
MGLSNVATGTSSLLAVTTGALVMDAVNTVAGVGAGPRAAFLLGVAYYAVAALLLRPVREPRGATATAAEPEGALLAEEG